MDGRRFDAWTRALSGGAPRRGALRVLAGGALALLGAGEAAAACKGKGGNCRNNNDCCKGLVCNNKDECEYRARCGGKKGDYCEKNKDCCKNKNLECRGKTCKRERD